MVLSGLSYRASALLFSFLLYFLLREEASGSICAAQVGSHFRLRLRKKSLKWKGVWWVGFFFLYIEAKLDAVPRTGVSRLWELVVLGFLLV